METMKRIGQGMGCIAYWASWPFFWFYFRLGHGRTRVVLRRLNGNVLVTKNWLSAGTWSMPGGGMHKGELPVEAAVRELYEEVKIVARPEALRLLGGVRYRAHGLEFDMYVFAMDYEGDITVNRYEIADAAWVAPASLTPANAGPDVRAALQMLQ